MVDTAYHDEPPCMVFNQLLGNTVNNVKPNDKGDSQLCSVSGRVVESTALLGLNLSFRLYE